MNLNATWLNNLKKDKPTPPCSLPHPITFTYFTTQARRNRGFGVWPTPTPHWNLFGMFLQILTKNKLAYVGKWRA